MTYTDDELAHASRVHGTECPFCWDTGYVTFMEMDQDGNSYPVPRPCPEGCLAPGEVPF